MDTKKQIEEGKAVLGIEFGSTRIKAVLIDGKHHPIASGSHEWENQLVDGVWTYSIDAIWKELQDEGIDAALLEGIAGLLSGYEKRCAGKIRCESNQIGCDWI